MLRNSSGKNARSDCPVTAAVFAALMSTAAMAAGIGVGALMALFAWASVQLPEVDEVASNPLTESSIVYSSDGAELARFHREHRVSAALSEVPDHLIDALLVTEDRRFLGHGGVDWRRIVTAMMHTMMGQRQGGSTLTMQLARNRYADIAGAPLLRRKAKEILMARRLERTYSKEAILEKYLNMAPFGQRATGIKAASIAYFDASLSDLSIKQSATLIAILKGSTYYNPVRNPQRAKVRRNLVLSLMEDAGKLSEEEAAAYRSEELALEPNSLPITGSIAPHAVRHLEHKLSTWAEENKIDLYGDGLRIHTTINAALQEEANEAVEEQLSLLQDVVAYEWSQANPPFLGTDPHVYRRKLEDGGIQPFGHLRRSKPELFARAPLSSDSTKTSFEKQLTTLQSGFVALDPRSGKVRAWVGSRGFESDEFDHVAQARRQPGSTFKPFVFAAAVDRGYRPDDIWTDGKVQHASTAHDDGMQLRQGMAYSSNALAMHLIEDISPAAVVRTARQMGINSPLRAYPSLAFGTSEVTLLELTSSYGTLANRGIHVAPRLVDRIEDSHGNELQRSDRNERRGSSAHSSYAVLDMMRDVVDYGTARDIRQQFGIAEADVAGKTGTTQNNADGWFVMAHPQLVIGSWVGFNDRRISFRSEHWGRGASNALRVVGQFARAALDAGAMSSTARFRTPAGYAAPRLQVQATSQSMERGGALGGWMGVLKRDQPESDIGMSSADSVYVRDKDPEAALRRAIDPPTRDED